MDLWEGRGEMGREIENVLILWRPHAFNFCLCVWHLGLPCLLCVREDKTNKVYVQLSYTISTLHAAVYVCERERERVGLKQMRTYGDMYGLVGLPYTTSTFVDLSDGHIFDTSEVTHKHHSPSSLTHNLWISLMTRHKCSALNTSLPVHPREYGYLCLPWLCVLELIKCMYATSTLNGHVSERGVCRDREYPYTMTGRMLLISACVFGTWVCHAFCVWEKTNLIKFMMLFLLYLNITWRCVYFKCDIRHCLFGEDLIHSDRFDIQVHGISISWWGVGWEIKCERERDRECPYDIRAVQVYFCLSYGSCVCHVAV